MRIPAQTRLGLHRHPDVHLAYVQKGTLTYMVERAVVNVYRGAADPDPHVLCRVAGGETGGAHPAAA